jgi:hypothetical protein
MFGRKAKLIRKLNDDLEKARYQIFCSEGKDYREGYYKKAITEKDSINKALAEENRDLVRQLELYKAVLAQLQIPIRLPGKKA